MLLKIPEAAIPTFLDAGVICPFFVQFNGAYIFNDIYIR